MSFEELILKPLINVIRNQPNNNAFCINDHFFTYRQLGQEISKVQWHLDHLASDEQYIGIVTNDDIETYATIFAVWMEGKTYIPLHVLQPLDRSNEIIRQVGIKIIFDSSRQTLFSGLHTINTFDLPNRKFSNQQKTNIPEETLAYILFTSGTTGKPKGVTITRGNIAAFVHSFGMAGIELKETDRCLQCFDLTFDVSVQSFLIPLICGACVYTIPTDRIKYSYAFKLLEEHHLTFGAMAPSMLRFLKPYFNEIHLPDMKCCILTAEASYGDLVEEWRKCIPNADILDFYGPTEGTIYCTYYKIETDKKFKTHNGLLSIGKPMAGFTAIIIDDRRNILETGIKGELCISGSQLTPGYWNNEERNKESFFYMPANGENSRFYQTGDLCFLDEEGDIMYSGRMDFQVKIQGYRVELSEIEFHARAYMGGINVIANTFIKENGNTEIRLFVEARDVDGENIENYLRSKLPHYMIPAVFTAIPEFPINSSGKVDRKKLEEEFC